MALDISKLLLRFVSESREHCGKITAGLLKLEGDNQDAEAVNAVFRSAHTIKGSARMMKQTNLADLAHSMEEVLEAIRSHRLELKPEVFDLLLRGVDALMAMLDQVDGPNQARAPEALLQELMAAAGEPGGPQIETRSGGQASPQPLELEPPSQIHDGPKQPESPLARPVAEEAYIQVKAGKLDDLIRLMSELIAEHGQLRTGALNLRDQEKHLFRHMDGSAGQGDKDQPGANGQALTRGLHVALAGVLDKVSIQGHLIDELREASLKLRMLPLSTVFDPLRRTVRDLAREFGKDIDFVISGGETELDRKIAEHLGDCLLHMIRNSLDHGLENAGQRVLAGKNPKGTIRLRAYHDSGGVTIAISDDGKGLPTEKIREKALAKRLLDPDMLERMSRAEVNNLIFLPGLSTSPIITDISGRGVGMDVVRKNIVDELKGSIMIETQEGLGSTFFLRLPLNLAVFPLFFLAVAQTTLAVPATSVVEILCLSPEEIINIVDKRAIRLREQIVPIEDLCSILKFPKALEAARDEITMVVVRDGDHKLGLVVDEILGREDAVVKPLPAHLRELKMVLGGTIGQGGGIINVLHVPELIRLARDLAGPITEDQTKTRENQIRILVVDDSLNTRDLEKSILEAYGYTVDVAEDGQEALDKTRGQQYDLIVTDIEMPRLDGFTLTERLRADQRYRHVPVIMVTSREKPEDKKKGIQVGADAYIIKRAFDQSNLLDTVRNLIG